MQIIKKHHLTKVPLPTTLHHLPAHIRVLKSSIFLITMTIKTIRSSRSPFRGGGARSSKSPFRGGGAVYNFNPCPL